MFKIVIMKQTIAFVTDMHLFEKLPTDVDQQSNWQRVLRDVSDKRPDRVVIGGDISEADHYGPFFGSVRDCADNIHVIPGNHDSTARLLLHFPNPETPDLGELYYSFGDDNFLYLFLDSSSGRISEPQLRWVREKLEDNQHKILLFIHHPVYEIDSYVDRKYPLENRDELRAILENQEREVFIFCGHNHCEDETGSGAISQYATPAVSYQVEKGTEQLMANADYFGYRWITLENGNVKSEIIKF